MTTTLQHRRTTKMMRVLQTRESIRKPPLDEKFVGCFKFSKYLLDVLKHLSDVSEHLESSALRDAYASTCCAGRASSRLESPLTPKMF
jgi:hypothetical protein